MKKFLGMFLAVSIVLSGIGAFAETASPAPTETPQVTVGQGGHRRGTVAVQRRDGRIFE